MQAAIAKDMEALLVRYPSAVMGISINSWLQSTAGQSRAEQSRAEPSTVKKGKAVFKARHSQAKQT